MSTNVRVVLATDQRRIGLDVGFPFSGLTSLLNSLKPTEIVLAFSRSQGLPTSLELQMRFEGPGHAKLFKDALIRCEGECDLQCEFLAEDAPQRSADWDYVEVVPDVTCLPSGKQIAVALPLTNAAKDIFANSYANDAEISYVVHLTRREGDADQARLLIPGLAELRRTRANTRGAEEAVGEAFELAREGGWSAREKFYAAAGKDRDRLWMEPILRSELKRQCAFLSDELLQLRWAQGESALPPDTLQTAVSRLRKGDFVTSLLATLVPSAPTKDVVTSCLEQARRHQEPPSRGDYAFISYAHSNRAFVQTLLRELDRWGVRYWIDSDLETGTKWDEELELRIRDCGALIACVTDEYQQSKYCRRELKFADVTDKIIFPIAPSLSKWGPGLQFMFQELQIAQFNDDRGTEAILATLHSTAPHIFK